MHKISLSDRMYAWFENLTMKLVPQKNVGPVFKWLFKFPILLHKLGLSWMMSSYVLLLTTNGRKSGKPRLTPVEYIYNPETHMYWITAGWAGNTDWYRNILADPHVTVQVGRRKFAALAERASDQEVAKWMQSMSKHNPRIEEVWNRWSDRLVDGSMETYVYAAKYFPSVWLNEIATRSPSSSPSQTVGMGK